MQKRGEKAQSKDADGTQKSVAIHLSLPSFASTSELLVLSRRREVFLEILQEQLVCLPGHRLFMLGLNVQALKVLMDTFEVDNKGR